MQLDLAHIATATGGTLVTAARMKKTTSKTGIVQHHSTFGVKKPKGALPGKSAGGWLKKNGKKVIIPDTRGKQGKLRSLLIDAGFKELPSSCEWTFRSGRATAYVGVNASDRVIFKISDAPLLPYVTEVSVPLDKTTAAQVSSFVSYVSALGAIKVPNQPRFFNKMK